MISYIDFMIHFRHTFYLYLYTKTPESCHYNHSYLKCGWGRVWVGIWSVCRRKWVLGFSILFHSSISKTMWNLDLAYIMHCSYQLS